ncbi:sigma factor-like helix-turn-helix DNA-binding protein [Plantibacter sp. MPB07]|uniref:sigma factor-like helix-turn-helix DNA-binding protein n=1 Tax=Plantibacter sp. MPB07 TaxID=3388853 RepID=UPI003987B9D7
MGSKSYADNIRSSERTQTAVVDTGIDIYRGDCVNRSWPSRYPWLQTQGISTTLVRTLEGLENSQLDVAVNVLAEDLVARRSVLTLGELAAGCASEMNLIELPLGARMLNTLKRRSQTDLKSVAHISVAQVLDWPQIGRGSVLTLIKEVLRVAGQSGPASEYEVSEAPAAWRGQLEAAVLEVAEWYTSIGQPDRILGRLEGVSSEPARIEAARSRILALSAREVADAGDRILEEKLGHIFASRPARDLLILRNRSFATKPLGLRELGEILGVSRQRVQQMEERALREVAIEIDSDFRLTELSQAIRDSIGSILPGSVLFAEFPVILREIKEIDRTAWRILQRLNGAYTSQDGWFGRPSVSENVVNTRAIVDSQIDHAATRVESVTESIGGYLGAAGSEWLQDWLTYCGYVNFEGYLIRETAGISERVAIVLEAAGEPLSSEEIHKRLGIERTVTATKNVLTADDRFARSNRGSWALRGWGLPEYRSIRNMIEAEIERAGGCVSLSELTHNLSVGHNVNPRSVASYASAHPFKTERGMTRLLKSDEIQSAGRSIWRTPKLHRGLDVWILRVVLTADHLRGSGTTLPAGLARALGVERGASRVFVTDSGDQLVSWKGPQPTLGSIRRLVGGDHLDDEVFLTFSDDGSFTVGRRRDALTPIDEILASVGLPSHDGVSSPWSALALSIGLSPTTEVAAIVAELRIRRDDDLADVLESI